MVVKSGGGSGGGLEICGRLHPDGVEEILFDKVFEALARQFFDDVGCDRRSGIAVRHPRAGSPAGSA